MTLKDIAREAGVSISTVSRIINGNSTKAASKELQDKIWKIARAGGYAPNTSAQTLKQKVPVKKTTSPSIACLYARSQDAQNDAFFSALTRSIEQESPQGRLCGEVLFFCSGYPHSFCLRAD